MTKPTQEAILQLVASNNIPEAFDLAETVEGLKDSPKYLTLVNLRAALSALEDEVLAVGETELSRLQRRRLTYDFSLFVQGSLFRHSPTKPTTSGTYYTRRPILGRMSFVDRDDETKRIREAVEEQNSFIALSGIGGVGKSTVAKKFLKFEGHRFDNILWVEAGSDLATAFIEQVDVDKLNFLSNDEIDQRDNLLKLFYCLEQLPGKSLCVVDGCDDREALDFLHHHFPENIILLVTTRVLEHPYVNIRVGAMDRENSIQLFEAHYQKKYDATSLRYILDAIADHTLTTELIGKLLRNAHHLSLSDLATALRPSSPERASQVDPAINSLSDHLATILRISELAPLETRLLHLFSLLPSRLLSFQEVVDFTNPAPIKLTAHAEELAQLFSKAIVEDAFRTPEEIKLPTKTEISQTLNSLNNKGWVQFQEEYFYLHPIFQVLMSSVATPEDIRQLTPQSRFLAAQLAHGSLTGKTARDFINGPLAFTVATATTFFARFSPIDESTLLGNFFLSEILLKTNQFSAALVALDRAESQLPVFSITDHYPLQKRIAQNKSTLLRETGAFQEAITCHRLLIDLIKREEPKNLNVLAEELIAFSVLHKHSGEIEKGYYVVEEVLSLVEKHESQLEATTIATVATDACAILFDKGMHDLAYTWLNKAELIHQQLAEDPILTWQLSDINNNQASVLVERKQYAEALKKQTASVSLMESLGDFTDPVLAHKYTKLANIHRLLGNHAVAAEYQYLAMDMRKHIYGDDHPLYAHALNYLGLLRADEGKYPEAQKAHEEALRIREKYLAEGSFEIGESLLNLGLVKQALNDEEGAHEAFSRSTALLRALSHPWKKKAERLAQQTAPGGGVG